MIANVSAHRRANAFAQALEEQSDREAAAVQQEEPLAEQGEQGKLLALATGLDELPKPELDPEVKVVQRAQLVAAMEAMLLEGTAAGVRAQALQCPSSARARALTGRARCGSCDPAHACPRASRPAASPSVSPREPSAASPLPAPTPSPVTTSTD